MKNLQYMAPSFLLSCCKPSPSRRCHPSGAGRNSQDAHSILQNADFLSLHQRVRGALRHLPASIPCPLKPDNQSAGGCWLALQQEQQHTHTKHLLSPFSSGTRPLRPRTAGGCKRKALQSNRTRVSEAQLAPGSSCPTARHPQLATPKGLHKQTHFLRQRFPAKLQQPVRGVHLAQPSS